MHGKWLIGGVRLVVIVRTLAYPGLASYSLAILGRKREFEQSALVVFFQY